MTPTHAESHEDARREQRTIEIEGRQVSYLSAGPADGAPLLLVHGGLGDAALHFERIAPLLARRFRVIAPDLPRFGGTAPLPDVSFDRLADWLLALETALGVERPVLVGNSFGAGLCRVRAARHPERVRGLVLLGGGLVPRIPRWIGWLVRTPLLAPLFWLMRRSAFSRRGLRKAIADERALDEVVPRAQASAASFVSLMREVALGPPPDTDRPACPVLAIWGEKDGLFPLPQGRAIASSVGAELVVLPGIAHMPQREAPDETAARIAAFVDGLPR